MPTFCLLLTTATRSSLSAEIFYFNPDDSAFEDTLCDIAGLYLNPPELYGGAVGACKVADPSGGAYSDTVADVKRSQGKIIVPTNLTLIVAAVSY